MLRGGGSDCGRALYIKEKDGTWISDFNCKLISVVPIIVGLCQLLLYMAQTCVGPKASGMKSFNYFNFRGAIDFCIRGCDL